MIFKYMMRRNAVTLVGERSSSFDLARGRLVMIGAFFVLVYALFGVRAFDLSVIRGDVNIGQNEQALAAQEGGDTSSVPEIMRADIVDRNGVMLATTLKSASLFADPYLIADPQATARGLVALFPDLSHRDVLLKLQSKNRFVWIKRNVLPAEQNAVLLLGEPGLDFRYESRRVYPQGALAAHLVGYTNIDNLGQAGVERSFNKLLGSGEPLRLTIDVRLQHALHREMSRTINEFNALGGVGVVMDVNTGEVLAGVSLPDFDPHDAGGADTANIFNRMTLGVYELGSVFKIFSTAALFETLGVPMSTTFDARHSLKRGRFTISDYHAEGRILTVPEVFMYSSNIGAAMMGEAVGTQALKGFYEDLGLLTPLKFEIGEVTPPLVPHPWGDLSTLTASYGHGLATTPVQLATAVAEIVNGGYALKPTVVLQEGDKPINSDRPNIRIVSEDTSMRMRQLLRLVVSDGTGKSADVKGYQVGGKTGTAEKAKGGGRKGYDRKRLISSFVGVFPMDEPRYVVFIAIDEPKGTKATFGYATGGWTAAPAVARVVASMAAILGLQPRNLPEDQDVSAPLKHFIKVKDKHG